MSTSAVTLSVSDLLGQESVTSLVASGSILVAIATNTVAKLVLTVANGTRQMAFWLGGGLVTMVATAFLLLFVGF